MAIVSGYSVLLFTLVLILRFGYVCVRFQNAPLTFLSCPRSVEAKMAPPSPQYPTATERGLYCLASIIAAIIGSGIGLFFFKYTRYWVCAMGGFALGWFIMACKAGGVTGNSIVGRWGLIGGKWTAVSLRVATDHLSYQACLWCLLSSDCCPGGTTIFFSFLRRLSDQPHWYSELIASLGPD